MLISFEFKNHHSYKDEQFFSMERVKSIRHEKPDIVTKYNDKLSRVTAIYGANASGKSGFLSAVLFVSKLMEHEENYYSILDQFQFGRMPLRESSEFSYIFIASNGIKYQYDLEYWHRGVNREALYVYESQKPSLVFERNVSFKNGLRELDQEFNFGAKFTSKNIEQAIKKEVTPLPHTLLLTTLKRLNEESTRPVYRFFSSEVIYNDAGNFSNKYELARERALKDKNFARVLNAVLPAVDFGIKEARPVAPSEQIVKALMKINPERVADKNEFIRKNTKFMFVHNGSVLNDPMFGEVSESRGTETTIGLASTLYDAIKDGSVCVVDEIDSSLHPILVAKIIELFNSAETNPHGAQLIFTTHDISLIENYGEGEILDRDQIWFARKDQVGRSDIFSLTDVKDLPRAGANIGVKYINGRYGATPDISIFESVRDILRKGAVKNA
ncbi:ATP-binding protein [Candidatus Saccharibacteria bacterium]|nr:ATP-binding protein [Candidatus Saccharibacteria bacterium]